MLGRGKSFISRHLKKIFENGELDKNSAVAKNATTALDGKVYDAEYFNLDAILAVGYRVNSKLLLRLALLVAMSNPNDKELMVKLIINLIKN